MQLDHYLLKNYVQHLRQFMLRHQLVPPSGLAWLGVSGGLDSLALLWLMQALCKQFPALGLQQLKVLHINHGTRPECAAEAELVQRLCAQLGIPCQQVQLQNQLDGKNFEAQARSLRYQHFASVLNPGDYFFTAHHIDDSFEWWLMQNLKSAKQKTGLGIPLFSGPLGPVVRPLMAFTRAQLERLQQALQFPYAEDSSNYNPKYERNFVRLELIPKLRERFPQYLKHYVHRSEAQARRLNLHRLQYIDPGADQQWRSGPASFGGRYLRHQHWLRKFYGADEQLLPLIEALSHSARGELRSQLRRLIQGLEAQAQGPVSFSGGVQAYLGQGIVVFLNHLQLKAYTAYDQKLLSYLQQAQLPGQKLKAWQRNWRQLPYPFLVFAEHVDPKLLKVLPSLKVQHPLLPLSSAWALEHKLWFQTLPRLFYWQLKAGPHQSRLNQLIMHGLKA